MKKKLVDNSRGAGNKNAEQLELKFWSGVRTVTGANFLISDSNTKILIDCGLIQGIPDADKENHKPFPYDASSIDALCITHAHLDHIGRIPKLVKEGFRGQIFSTPETREITELMLEDLLRVQKNHAMRDGNENKPSLFEEKHIHQTFALWKTYSYHDSFSVDTPNNPSSNFSVEFLDAGHILGSAMVKLTHGDRRILFTGDTGNSPSPLIKDTETLEGIDYLIIDSVYGDRNHEPKSERGKHFAEIVRDAIARKGTLVIPAFSLERTQILLYELDKLVETGQIPSVPVFLDSPLAIKLTSIYKKSIKLFNKEVSEEMQNDDIFHFPKLKISFSGRDSSAIAKVSDPKIIIAGSGMSSGGRVLGHESLYLPGENNTLLLTGYQSVGTLGRLIEEGAKEIEINGEKIPVRAYIETVRGYSGHRDSEGLLELIETAEKTLKKVFVVMGEPKSALFLVQRIRDYLGIEAVSPQEGKTYLIG